MLNPHSLPSLTSTQTSTLKNNQLGRDRILKKIITMATSILCKELRDYCTYSFMETLCFEAGSDSVAQAGQELAILLPQLLDAYDYRQVLPHPAL